LMAPLRTKREQTKVTLLVTYSAAPTRIPTLAEYVSFESWSTHKTSLV
jgi:hypothetical protein